MKIIKDLGICLSPSGRTIYHFKIYECPYCSSHFKANMYNMNRGITISCGCNTDNHKGVKNGFFRHGMAKSSSYQQWINIKKRIFDPLDKSYRYYGGRGICLYRAWINDFKSFYDYVSMLPNFKRKKYTIDRIDVNGNYEPGNLRWATQHIQSTNQNFKISNTSGFEGVSLHKKNSQNGVEKWIAYITINKKRIYLGSFKDKQKAALIRNNYIIANNLIEYKLNDIK